MIYELLFVNDTTIIWQSFRTYPAEDSMRAESGFKQIAGTRTTMDRTSDEVKDIDAYNILRSGWQPISVAMTTVAYRRPWQEKPMIDISVTLVIEKACKRCQLNRIMQIIDGYIECPICGE